MIGDSAEMRAAKIAVLRKARGMIESKKQGFICYALNRAASTTREDLAVILLKNYIDESLCGNKSLSGWQGGRCLLNKVRNDRLAWIDWMIESLESEGA